MEKSLKGVIWLLIVLGHLDSCIHKSVILRESIPRHIDKKSGGPQGERSGVLEEQIGVWSSQGGGKDKLFSLYIP